MMQKLWYLWGEQEMWGIFGGVKQKEEINKNTCSR